MNKSRTLLTHHSLTIEVEDSPGQELMEHMHQTVMGQPGGLQYHHTDLEDRMKSGAENYFMYLRKSGKMLGSVGFCSKPTETDGFPHDSWLIRYFSIKAPIKGVPKKRKTREELQDEHRRTSVLGRFIQPILANPSQLREGEDRTNLPAIVFAVIDQTNLRSMNFSSQMGLETVRSLAGFSFSRLRPHRSSRIETVDKGDQAVVLDQIRSYYRNYTLFYSDSIFKNKDYYVIKEAGRMVAGMQIYEVTWKIVDFGSALANRASGLLSIFPGLRKRINKDQVSFLALDAIYCGPGHEKDLYELIEGVLERRGHHMAVIMCDMGSDLYGIFRKNKKLGLLHKLIGTTHADVRVRFINVPDAVRKQFFDRPTYIPTYDNS